jgi:hypothetical protein
MLLKERIPELFMHLLGSGPVGLDLLCSMQICYRFPCVITVWVSSPLDEVLELLCSPKVVVFGYPLHLIFFFTFYEVWRWLCIVWAMHSCLMIGGKKRGMEYIVDVPGCRKF